ncbi:MAG: hypothetical protein ABIY47_01455, partial [Opitutaceae bacterium]
MTLANLDEHRSWWVLIALNTVLAMAPAVRDWIRGRLDLFNPRHVILLFLWLTYAVWPAWVILAGYEKFDSIT